MQVFISLKQQNPKEEARGKPMGSRDYQMTVAGLCNRSSSPLNHVHSSMEWIKTQVA